MAVQLTSVQKDEIRRLTQLANRRIKAAERAYQKEGQAVLPREVAGDYQIKEKWATDSTPISRSVKFESEEDYKQQLKQLRRFERERPGIKEFRKVQQQKTQLAVKDVLGENVPQKIMDKIDKMTAPEINQFWKTFERKATRLGMDFASEQVLIETMNEMFEEDIEGMSSQLTDRG